MTLKSPANSAAKNYRKIWDRPTITLIALQETANGTTLGSDGNGSQSSNKNISNSDGNSSIAMNSGSLPNPPP